MAQVVEVLKGDPTSVRNQLITLAAANELLIVEKTFSSGSYLVIYDNAGSTSQDVTLLVGDPTTVAAAIDAIAATDDINIVSGTFSGSHYLVVHA